MSTRKRTIRRGTVKRYVETDALIAVLDVPVIYAPEAPGEPLLDVRAIKLLDEAQRRAEAGDRRWLRRHGRLYTSVPA